MSAGLLLGPLQHVFSFIPDSGHNRPSACPGSLYSGLGEQLVATQLATHLLQGLCTPCDGEEPLAAFDIVKDALKSRFQERVAHGGAVAGALCLRRTAADLDAEGV